MFTILVLGNILFAICPSLSSRPVHMDTDYSTGNFISNLCNDK